MHCSNCGKAKEDEGKFCHHCGKESILRQESEKSEKTNLKPKKLSGEELSEKAWWRFARAIFGLVSAILVIMTLLGLGIALNETNIVDEDQSEFQCSSGEKYQLSKIIEKLEITFYYSNEISDNKFTRSDSNAKAKIFCQALNYDRDIKSGPITWIDFIDPAKLKGLSQEAFAYSVVEEAASWKYGTLNELAEDKYIIIQVKNADYTIDTTYDFSSWNPIFGLTVLALIIEAILLLTIRGVARYTLIGKFF